MDDWFLESLVAGGAVGLFIGWNHEWGRPFFWTIITALGAGFFLDLFFDFPGRMIWQCDKTYVLRKDIESCVSHALNFPWYLLLAAVSFAGGNWIGKKLQDKREEREKRGQSSS